ncbi:MAG: hypothetical protein HY820_34745 [Acidobacteria bacterium]|nr:hypothetical protein [Acidobacteriota bacterium]
MTAKILPSGFALAHDSYNGMGAASDGKIYYVLSSESYETGAQVYAYDPATGQSKHLGDLTEACGEKGKKTIVQGKSHVPFFESNGKLYFATHIGYYSIIDGMEKMGVPPAGWKPYPGGHVLAIDMATGKMEDLGLLPGGEGIITLNLDAKHRRLFGLTWPTGNFFRFDIAKKEFKNFGPYFEKGENGKGNSYRTICRSIAVRPEDGAAWFSRGEGTLFRYDPDTDTVASFAGETMKKDYFGLYDVTNSGHMAYNWRQVVWVDSQKAFFGVHGNSGYLFKFDPKLPSIEIVDRITSEPSKRSGMFDQFSYGYLGFTLGPDGHTLHYLTGGPVYEGGRRVTGKDSTAKGEAKGTENLHLITFDTAANKYTDLGPIFYENGDRPTYVNSIAVGKDGTVYTSARIKSGEGHAELIAIRP